MITVIFEVQLKENKTAEYLEIASQLLPLLQKIDGFISIERFQSLANPEKILSLSFWRDEEAVKQWRGLMEHRTAQEAGRATIFADYTLRVAHVLREYGLNDREGAPQDSQTYHQ